MGPFSYGHFSCWTIFYVLVMYTPSAISHPYRTYRRYSRYRPFYRIPILYMAYTTIPPIPYTPTLALHYRH
ncbi:hypothetical protein EDD85DRAFT_870568 [Armillaria nabsnona]|nr:hypothetical protein EDD85DRAFT_870568 [Armillaria nabsnona]